mmetsp:Transcript_29438/g.46387  ORF Transcript_29438/g.46387 Transcript_29438/m.46387 type:complete len:136 (-) Transcript_29438:1961-2368(-)
MSQLPQLLASLQPQAHPWPNPLGQQSLLQLKQQLLLPPPALPNKQFPPSLNKLKVQVPQLFLLQRKIQLEKRAKILKDRRLSSLCYPTPSPRPKSRSPLARPHLRLHQICSTAMPQPLLYQNWLNLLRHSSPRQP